MEGEERLPLGKNLRYFGDGHQISKQIDGRRYWRVPVMDGEFLVEEDTGRCAAVGGGNFLVLARGLEQALSACEDAVEAMRKLPNVVLPFPGGIVRSGSKVGSKYKALMASTNDAYCPTLRGLVDSQLGNEVGAVLEIVVNGLDEQDVGAAMRTAKETGSLSPPKRRGHAHRDRGGVCPWRRRGHRAHLRRQLRRQARPVPLQIAQRHGHEVMT